MADTCYDAAIDPSGRELLSHGSALFPVASYADDLAHAAVPWHWHDELEAAVVTEGTALVAAGGKKLLLRPGQGFFVSAGVLHAAWPGDAAGCRLHSVVFHPRLVGGGLDSIFWQNYLHPVLENAQLKALMFDGSAPWHAGAEAAVETAWQSCETAAPGYEFAVREALSRLIFTLASHCPAAPRASEKSLRDARRIKTMLQYIQQNYPNELQSADIAASAAVSESECLRCFRTVIGMPPMQYVRQLRLQKAAELLAGSQLKISEIGAQCGFADESYFTKTFREKNGCAPGEYRRRAELL